MTDAVGTKRATTAQNYVSVEPGDKTADAGQMSMVGGETAVAAFCLSRRVIEGRRRSLWPPGHEWRLDVPMGMSSLGVGRPQVLLASHAAGRSCRSDKRVQAD